MTREISEYAEREGSFRLHITSLNPLSPHSSADEFERKALELFKGNEKEVFSTEKVDGKLQFRYMAPLIVEESCLMCHARQGYIVGDVRGGISVSFPIDNMQARLRTNSTLIIALATTTTTLLLGLIYFFAAGLIMRISEARQQIEKMATTDGLTGVFNRSHLMMRFQEELHQAKRLKHDLSCIIVDIDRFKAVNDKYGHLVGDEVLRGIASRIAGAIRAYDILGRYGGEEFLIVLPETDLDAARLAAERIRIGIKEAPICNVEVTVSLGIACRHEQDESEDDIFRRADVGLYTAKSLGRDRVSE